MKTASKKKKDTYKERAEFLVKNFSDKDGKGSVTTNCECWPECQCVTYEPPSVTPTRTTP
jgi:hypothetical protein